MQSTVKDVSKVIEINSSQNPINSVLFVEDGQQVLSGGDEGIFRWWRVTDGHEVGEPIREEDIEIYFAALSPDGRWLACGITASNDEEQFLRVWDVQTHKEVPDIHGPSHTSTVLSVDFSPDSARLATSSIDQLVFIRSTTTGERLVGPLQHDGWVVSVRFSPSGDRIATATAQNTDARSIRIYDSDNGKQLLDIPFHFYETLSSSLVWSADGHQLFAASYHKVERFDASSGSLLSEWSLPGDEEDASIVLSRSQRFAVVITDCKLSLWDVSKGVQIGSSIEHESKLWCVALSPNDNCIATGDEGGKVTLRDLRDILPASYLTVNVSDLLGHVVESEYNASWLTPFFISHPSQLPFMFISNAVFESWTQGDLARVEELLTEEIIHPSNSFYHARALAHRALVRARSKRCDMAMDDAQKSIQVQRTVIGYIAHAITHISNGHHESAKRVFDLVFTECLPHESKLLLLIRAIILFECGKHDNAILRVGDLIDIVDDQSPYVAVRGQMHLLLGNMAMGRGDNERAVELFKLAQEAIPFRQGPYLVLISLIFGWDFNRLAPTIQLHLWKAMYAVGRTEVAESLSTMVSTLGEEVLTSDVAIDWDPDLVQKCLTTFESSGDNAARSMDLKGAIVQYTTALSLNPSNPGSLLVKRSKTQAMLCSWEDALKDADEAIKVDSSSPWGYERKHAALHGLQRYDEAMSAFARMYSLIEGSLDRDIRQLSKKYVSPSRSEMVVDNIVRGVIKVSPIVLIDVKSGRLCDVPERTHTFKSELEFKELVSSMTEELDDRRIQRVVEEYFRYVTLSHVWEGKEPSFQDVRGVGSVWELDSSPLNEKLRKFCKVVRTDGYRWAWCDTCCIDKTIGTVLNQSLRMMFKWYEASAATFVLLVDATSPSTFGDLTNSIWMTRAWTAQELLAAKVIRFYDREWKPYLSDARSDHKESPEIMQELADAINVAHETIIAFNPDDLTVREKLRLASTRNATIEEDVAYSLIGIFKSDIRPDYGEGDAALGHLLEEIVSRSGEVTVLDWTGQSSSYNSCLPATIAVYGQPPDALPTIIDAEMDSRVATLRNSLSQTDAILAYDRVTRLPPARFANRRLHLPCIVFAIKRLSVHDSGSSQRNCYRYRARVSGIGYVEFQTSNRLSSTEPRRLILVHPWIRDLQDPLDSFTWGSTVDGGDENESDSGTEFESAPSSPMDGLLTTAMNDNTRALRLIVRLQRPFRALLLQQQPSGEFKRIAAEHEIVVPGIERRVNFARDIRAEVVEIL